MVVNQELKNGCGRFDLHKFFLDQLIVHSKEYNGQGSYPLTQVRQIFSQAFKKKIMNKIIFDLESEGFLRYSKAKARVFILREVQNHD